MRRRLPAILLLFIGSGCAALIYEVVWLQLLQLSIGSSAVSVGILLGVYMGGMGLGSLALPRWVGARHHPLQVYAVLELGIAALGVLALFGVPWLGGVYTGWTGVGSASLMLRALVATVCLVPPTMLMGATLPAVARWVETSPLGVSWLGYLYGGNLAGAVVGSLLAGFYLLRLYDVTTATAVAVAVNVLVAELAFALARTTPHEPPARAVETPVTPHASTVAYIAIALSGFTALGAEVVWTRLLSLMLGATVYTFSLILAVFLLGLGIGTSAGSAMARRVARPGLALGVCQAVLCVAVGWAAYASCTLLPLRPVDLATLQHPLMSFLFDLQRATIVVLPASVLWGMSFPLAMGAVASNGSDPARLVGGVYAANTTGAIAGSLLTSLWLVGSVGSQFTQQVLIGLSGLSAVLMLLSTTGIRRPLTFGRVPASLAVLILVAGVAGLATRMVPPLPGILVAYGRNAGTSEPFTTILYTGEGVTASVAISRSPDGVLNYHNAGKVQASSEPQDMRLQRMLGHITTLVPRNPSHVLVIGCGAGVTAGAVSIDPLVRKETIAEIEPLVPRAASAYFAAHNFDVVRNPKVTLQIDDARHYLLTTKDTFDAITSDPLDPWVKGAATLYTREFLELVKAHLTPDGVVTLFVQLYQTTESAVKSEVATFFEAFPDGVVFANLYNGEGYDLVLMGQRNPRPIDLDAIEARMRMPENARVRQSLSDIGIPSAVALFGTYAGRASDMAGWLRGADINRDRNLRLQYLAGSGVNLYDSAVIYQRMTATRRYPDGVFAGSEATLRALRDTIGASQPDDDH